MAKLILKEGLPNNFPLEHNYEVDIDEWGYSSNTPLATIGAGPCLNVVVHNRETNVGCLAHVGHSSLKQTILFLKALKIILIMMHSAGAGAGAKLFDLWFGAGWAFVENSEWAPEQRFNIDFVTFIEQQLKLIGYSSVEILDSRTVGLDSSKHYDPGNVAYWPPLNSVYMIVKGKIDPETGHTDTRHIWGVQTKKSPPVGGKIL